MIPGPTLDALVAEHIFKWKWIAPTGSGNPPSGHWRLPDGTIQIEAPKWSTNKELAFKVWDEMYRLGEEIQAEFFILAPENLKARPLLPGEKLKYIGEDIRPEEICIAALKAVGVEEI